MKIIISALLFLYASLSIADEGSSRYIEPDYKNPKVVYDFYFDEPTKINSALFWIRALINPLMDAPYNLAPESMQIKVVIHGTEIVTVAKKNYTQYKEAVERMRYYASLGVEFKVCNLAAIDYDYKANDFHEFIDVVPSAFTELSHWQQQGFALIIPRVHIREKSIHETR